MVKATVSSTVIEGSNPSASAKEFILNLMNTMTEEDKTRIQDEETLRLRKIGCILVLAAGLIGTLCVLGLIHIITML